MYNTKSPRLEPDRPITIDRMLDSNSEIPHFQAYFCMPGGRRSTEVSARPLFNYLPDRRLCTQLVHVHSGISKLPLIFEKSQFGLDYTFVDLLRILYLLNCWKDSKKPFTNDYYSFERQWILYFWLMSGKL